MTVPVDIWLLPTHPYIGRSADHFTPVHVESYDEAVQLLANMPNGGHYEICQCCHEDAS